MFHASKKITEAFPPVKSYQCLFTLGIFKEDTSERFYISVDPYNIESV